jgi:AcrR family transcriptional regulator
MATEITTEERILDAARNVFLRKGMVGARMQEVADEAGINKALLHYYFRNKQQLFEQVFCVCGRHAMQGMWVELTQDRPLFDNIRAFVMAFHTAMEREPHFPHFMLNELRRDPQHLLKLVDLGKGAREQFFKQVKAAQQRGEIIAIEPLQLMVNMMAWCWFPHVAAPVVKHVGGIDQKAFNQFLKERSTLVSELIIRSIQR